MTLFKWFATPGQLHHVGVLSMNCRNHEIIARLNKRCLYPLVDDKSQTKILATEFGIQTPHLIGTINAQHEVKDFLNIIGSHLDFVVKPAHGSSGKGVLVIKHFSPDKFITASDKELTFQEVYQHISNTLSGLYSLGGQYDTVLFEEVVHFSDIFKDYSFQGVPDVRVIVYKGFPVVAMMRLATKESGGRANLHQGAVGVGINIQTGRAVAAVQHNRPILKHPDTGADLLEIQVPNWPEHLQIAIKGYEMTGLGYLGADIVLDKQRGPMMLELNARPGLAIQIANRKGLKKILRTVDKEYPIGLTTDERLDFVLNHLTDNFYLSKEAAASSK